MSKVSDDRPPAPPFKYFERFVEMANAVERGYNSYDRIEELLRKNDREIAKGTLSACVNRLEDFWGLKKNVLFGRNSGSPLTITPETAQSVQAAERVIAAVERRPEARHQTDPSSELITISTENLLERIAVPSVTGAFFKRASSPRSARIAVLDAPSLLHGLDQLRSGRSDLVLYSVYPEMRGSRWGIPKFERLQAIDFEFPLVEVAVIPKRKAFEELINDEGSIEMTALQDYPLAMVEEAGMGRSILEDESPHARAVLSSVAASIRCALGGQFVGLAHNWPQEFGSENLKQVCLRRIETSRKSLRVVCYVREQRHSPNLSLLLECLKDYFAEQRKELVDV